MQRPEGFDWPERSLRMVQKDDIQQTIDNSQLVFREYVMHVPTMDSNLQLRKPNQMDMQTA